jgi:hypothetical protein
LWHIIKTAVTHVYKNHNKNRQKDRKTVITTVYAIVTGLGTKDGIVPLSARAGWRE